MIFRLIHMFLLVLMKIHIPRVRVHHTSNCHLDGSNSDEDLVTELIGKYIGY